MVYFQVSQIDTRIPNPDQRLTQDIDKWANSLSTMYSNFSKPLLDIVLFSKKLSELVGWDGPCYLIGWYFVSGTILRYLSPSFGRWTAEEQKLEGEFRACHTNLQQHCEEIAFYRGHQWERKKMNESYNELHNHSLKLAKKKMHMGIYDSM